MKLVYFGAQEGDEEVLRAEFPDLDVKTVDEPLSLENVDEASEAEIVSVFVQSEVSADVLKRMPNVQLVAARSTGFDHVDAAQAKEQGVAIANVPDYGGTTVAEHAFALIMSLSRKMFQSYERTERMNFNRDGLTGFDLQGKTIGVIGGGNIGQEVIRIAHGFDMDVLVYDVKPNQELATKLDFAYAESLDDLLSNSDVITLHVPYLEATHHLINKDNIGSIKRGSILINTARGGLVETEALLQALEQGILSGAGLDVLEEENDAHDRVEFMSREEADEKSLRTLLHNHLLVGRDDVIITPHNAFNSREAVQRIFQTTVDNIKGFLNNEPINIVE